MASSKSLQASATAPISRYAQPRSVRAFDHPGLQVQRPRVVENPVVELALANQSQAAQAMELGTRLGGTRQHGAASQAAWHVVLAHRARWQPSRDGPRPDPVSAVIAASAACWASVWRWSLVSGPRPLHVDGQGDGAPGLEPGRGRQVVECQLRLVAIQFRLLVQPQVSRHGSELPFVARARWPGRSPPEPHRTGQAGEGLQHVERGQEHGLDSARLPPRSRPRPRRFDRLASGACPGR